MHADVPGSAAASGTPTIRPACESDVGALLPLMVGLAEYEGYSDRFAVTEAVLREQGFRRSPPDFHTFVAEGANGGLLGMVVYFFIPFTFTSRPTLYVKELFVAPAARGSGVGEQLMRAVAREAVARGCDTMKWQVARWNTAAMSFYARLGARADGEWLDFRIAEDALRALAGGEVPQRDAVIARRAPRPAGRVELARSVAVFARIALGVAFLSAVAGRLGLWGPAGAPDVACGATSRGSRATRPP